MRLRARHTPPTLAIIAITIATALILGSIALGTPFQTRAVSVNISSFDTDFAYDDSSIGYLSIISSVSDRYSVLSRDHNQLRFSLSLVVQNDAPLSRKITSISALTAGFRIISSDIPALPAMIPQGGGLSFSIIIRYENTVDYSGPLKVEISTA